MKKSAAVPIRGPFMFPCVQCGAQCMAGHAVDETMRDTGEVVVTHRRPWCSKFDGMEADAFVKEAREHYGFDEREDLSYG